jgi:NTE family protein
MGNTYSHDANNSDAIVSDKVISDEVCIHETEYTPEYYYEQELAQLKQIDVAKKDLNYNGIVFEGGGVKAIAYVGVLRALYNKGIYDKFWRFAGTSAGAIVATLLAIGYNAEEAADILYNTDFSSFLDDKTGIVRDTINMFHKYGVCKGDVFEKFIVKYIEEKTQNRNYTFKELYDFNKIELVIVVTDLKHNTPIYLSYHTYPDMPICLAVRASMSIPYLFQPVNYENMMLVDGGVLDNYPIHVFDGNVPGDTYAEHNLTSMNPHIIGCRLATLDEEQSAENGNSINGLRDLTATLLNIVYNVQEKQHIRPGYWKRTVMVEIPNISAIEFNIDDDDKADLVRCGELSMNRFLS